MAPKVVITGTVYSGTEYMAQLLNENKIKCGHESWFNLTARTPGFDVESSWLALPALEKSGWVGPVVHVIRNPVDAVGLIVSSNLLRARRRDQLPYREFVEEHVPEIVEMDHLEAAVEFWVAWNERCAKVARTTVRLEEIENYLNVLRTVLRRRIRTFPARVEEAYSPVDQAKLVKLLDGREEQFGYKIELDQIEELEPEQES
jgi:hypothetical protein